MSPLLLPLCFGLRFAGNFKCDIKAYSEDTKVMLASKQWPAQKGFGTRRADFRNNGEGLCFHSELVYARRSQWRVGAGAALAVPGW